MKTKIEKAVWLLVNCLLVVFLGCAGNTGNAENANTENIGSINNTPIITSLAAYPAIVIIGGMSTIICDSTDADNDSLTYTWIADDGTIVNTGIESTVIWTAPISTGIFTITCKVSDAKTEVSSQVSVNTTKFSKINNYLQNGAFTYLIGEVSSGGNNATSLRIEKRDSQNSLVWEYEDAAMVCQDYWMNIGSLNIGSRCSGINDSGNLYIAATKQNYPTNPNFPTFYDTAIYVVKIRDLNDRAERDWEQVSDLLINDLSGETAADIKLVNNFLYVFGFYGCCNNSFPRIEKYALGGQLINRYFFPQLANTTYLPIKTAIVSDGSKTTIYALSFNVFATGKSLPESPFDMRWQITAIEDNNNVISMLWNIIDDVNGPDDDMTYIFPSDIVVNSDNNIIITGCYKIANSNQWKWRIETRFVDGFLLNIVEIDGC